MVREGLTSSHCEFLEKMARLRANCGQNLLEPEQCEVALVGGPAKLRTRGVQRFDFDHTWLPRQVVAIAAPLPVFRILYQPAPYRIRVNVTQLFDSLFRAPHVEVIVPGLPEVPAHPHSSSRYRGLRPSASTPGYDSQHRYRGACTGH